MSSPSTHTNPPSMQRQALSVITLLADKITPVLAFERLRSLSEYGFLLESSEQDSRLARFSILGIGPLETLTFNNGTVQIATVSQADNSLESSCSEECPDPLKFLQTRSKMYEGKLCQENLPADLPFVAGYVGYLGYGSVAYFDKIPQQKTDNLNVPDGVFSFYDSLLIFDHKERSLKILSYRGEKHAQSILDALNNKTDNRIIIRNAREEGSSQDLSSMNLDIKDAFNGVSMSMTRSDFLTKVEQAKEFVAQGQVFQIVLAQRFERSYRGDAFKIYRALQCINPSPYGYFLQFPGFSYLGASPERLLQCRSSAISLTALAGTRPRGKNEAEEKELEAELKSNEKELAEHYMLVDLGRNDLGRVAEIGSVQCAEIARVTRYGQVMHLSTDISAKLSSQLSSFDAVRSCFPAGTVSGAPKIRAMELLAQLEPERRGIYSGLVGYFDIAGNVDSAIAIRSALVKDGIIHVSAGAGIVQDSIAESEYEETRNKALSVLKAVAIADSMQ